MCIPLLFVFYFFSHVLTRENQYISPLQIQNFLSFTNFSCATCRVKERETTFTILLDLYHKEEGKYTSCPDAQQFKPTVRPWRHWDTLQYCKIYYTVTSLRQCFFFVHCRSCTIYPALTLKWQREKWRPAGADVILKEGGLQSRGLCQSGRTCGTAIELWGCSLRCSFMTHCFKNLAGPSSKETDIRYSEKRDAQLRRANLRWDWMGFISCWHWPQVHNSSNVCFSMPIRAYVSSWCLNKVHKIQESHSLEPVCHLHAVSHSWKHRKCLSEWVRC